MSEMQRVVDEFSANGLLAAIRWAHLSAARTSLANHLPREGYTTNRTRGTSLYELTVERMDRVAQCGAFQPDPSTPEDGRDLLHDGIDPDLPLGDVLLPPGHVIRDDIRGSEGWRFGEWRWLRASFKFGEVSKIRWRGLTKQQVAAQDCVDYPALFPIDENEKLHALFGVDLSQTLVVAQALDSTTQDSQLYIGRPRLNTDSDSSWYWLYDLLGAPPDAGRSGIDRTPTSPVPEAPREVADAPVRLRPAPTTPGKRSTDQG
ncbi:hypothetical protein [Allosalinactinospora lopnorensis]|uniref:hypothetical protein n=1 Tax=Allosalinactinospora lopnorensis TaxID=1352348 RepID=UPI000623F750|nr:hypothetical protein [Allosalinactinospora lopnorensis]